MIGIDIVQISEFEANLRKGGQSFLNKTFDQSELTRRETNRLAGIFAAKEACVKALGKYPDSLKEIVIKKDGERPYGTYRGRTINVSISHHGDYAVAAALL